MIGRSFQMTGSFVSGITKLSSGDIVKVTTWDNASEAVTVRAPGFSGGLGVTVDVPKRLLKSAISSVAGMDAYSAGVAGQQAAVVKAEPKHNLAGRESKIHYPRRKSAVREGVEKA